MNKSQIKMLRDGDLSVLDEEHADLRGANLKGAQLAGVHFSCTELEDANFKGANLKGALFIHCEAGGCNLSGANLHDVEAEGCDFRGANFSGSDLTGAYFSNCDFRDANFKGAALVAAEFDECTMPDNWPSRLPRGACPARAKENMSSMDELRSFVGQVAFSDALLEVARAVESSDTHFTADPSYEVEEYCESAVACETYHVSTVDELVGLIPSSEDYSYIRHTLFTSDFDSEIAVDEVFVDAEDGEEVEINIVTLAGKWRTVQTFFSESAAQAYIKSNSHRHEGKLRLTVESFYRNPEMIAVREFLLSVAKEAKRLEERPEETMPPTDKLGKGEFEIGTRVRYWPLKDLSCRPHEGFVQGKEVRHDMEVLWITGKSGYVLAAHCEILASEA